MLEQLKAEVCQANLTLPARQLVVLTWGNVSGVDRDAGYMVIKPSGVEYDEMTVDDMVVVDIETGAVAEGELKPSSDAETHLALYRNFKDIGGVAHTHSRWATVYAQAARGIPAFGTTHADYFCDEIPCARFLTPDEIAGAYEAETGKVIVETFVESAIDPNRTPAVLAAGHGPFTWGKTAGEAARNAAVLEEIAFMAWHNQMTQPDLAPITRELTDKHYYRKHGEGAYYGQGRRG